MNLQEQYFKAIYNDFASKITLLAELIREHPGERGRFVEKVLSEFLESCLPNHYAMGTGFVIDSEGNRSRQCDIIIYDTRMSSGLFRHGGQVFFPVESVYATIEVKTTLSKAEVEDACAKIASVKRLINKAGATFEWSPAAGGTVEYREFPATAPLGFIVGYQSETNHLETIRQWFVEAFRGIPDPQQHPDLSVSIMEAIKIRYAKTSHHPDSLEMKFYPVPLRSRNGEIVRDPLNGPLAVMMPKQSGTEIEYVGTVEEDGYLYNCHFKKCCDARKPNVYVLTDAPRLLLTSLASIEILLKMKRLSGAALEIYFDHFYNEAISL